MYTGQDRLIQKELAFTPAKNATKQNPFKIIPLQSAGKENSWETEETLERAAVNCGDGTGQMAQPLMFMMMMMIMFLYICIVHTAVLFQSSVSVYRPTQYINLLSKTNYTSDIFRPT
jgi:hypothetical protein